MPVSRYKKNDLVNTTNYEHENLLDKRGVRVITHYSFAQFKTLKIRDIANINIVTHTWESSDRFYKLSSKYYGDPTYWWIIAYFNNKPLETDLNLGEIVEIPVPLEKILIALDY
tara:strand:- start:1589 stop:1930 length:342 start_codon:yes stop_codon:yes gene_type:complete